MTQPISIATSTFREPPRLIELVSYGTLLNAKDAFAWLHRHSGFIGWTYSINLKVWTLLQPERLIIGTDNAVNKRIRYASCCHIKCYISDDEMLIGSLNLVTPTIEDYCVQISDKKQITFMRKQFERAWKALA